MRHLLTVAAALLAAASFAMPHAAAQQSFPPPKPAITAPAPPPTATAAKKPRAARAKPQRTRHAALAHRAYSPCQIIDGWRAFPSRDPKGFFDTRRVCSKKGKSRRNA
jgi:hypothetical protein